MSTVNTNDLSEPSSLPSPPAPTVWPTVGFVDIDAGIRLLVDGFGFIVTALYRNDDGTVEHAEARWPDGGGVMFGSRGKPGDWGAGPQGVYVVAAGFKAKQADAYAKLQQALIQARDTPEFQAVKSRLQKMRAAPAMPAH